MSAEYSIFIRRSALRELRKVPQETAGRIVAAIDSLAVKPRPTGCRKLVGRYGAYRIRVGDYRVVYVVDDSAITVEVVRVGHRRDIYRSR